MAVTRPGPSPPPLAQPSPGPPPSPVRSAQPRRQAGPLAPARPLPSALSARCPHRPPAPARPPRAAAGQPRSAMARRGPAPPALRAGGRAGPPGGTAGAVNSVSSARLSPDSASLTWWKLRPGQAVPRLKVLRSSAQVRVLPAPAHGSPAVGVCARSLSLPPALSPQPLVVITSRGFPPATEHACQYPLETDSI